MSNVQPRLEGTADTLAGLVVELREMLTDHRIDDDELRRLADVAHELGAAACEVEDVILDYRLMDQVWRLGRQHAPNAPLSARMEDLAQVRQQYAPVGCRDRTGA